MKSVLIIGGGEIGLNQITWAREVGFNVIVTDRDPRAPGLKIADIPVTLDATDISGLSAYCLANQDRFNISSIYCGNDFGLVSVAVLSELLNIPGIPVAAAVRSVNKELMKSCWHTDDLPTPRGFVADSMRQVRSVLSEIGLPAVIKPTSASGSRGVRIVERIDEAEAVFQAAQAHAPQGHVLLESYVDGTHHDVNGLFWDNKYYDCGVMDRHFTPLPYCVPVGGYDPSGLPSEMQKELHAILEKAARAIGISFGPVKGDFVVSSDGRAFIYELAARFHGDVSTSHTSARARSMSPVKLFMQATYDGEIPQEVTRPSGLLSAWRAIVPAAGKVRKIKGLDAARELAGIDKILLKISEGDTVPALQDNTGVAGFVWLSGRSRAEIDQNYAIFRDTLQIEYF